MKAEFKLTLTAIYITAAMPFTARQVKEALYARWGSLNDMLRCAFSDNG